jgi:hypothetical protein
MKYAEYLVINKFLHIFATEFKKILTIITIPILEYQ